MANKEDGGGFSSAEKEKKVNLFPFYQCLEQALLKCADWLLQSTKILAKFHYCESLVKPVCLLMRKYTYFHSAFKENIRLSQFWNHLKTLI